MCSHLSDCSRHRSCWLEKTCRWFTARTTLHCNRAANAFAATTRPFTATYGTHGASWPIFFSRLSFSRNLPANTPTADSHHRSPAAGFTRQLTTPFVATFPTPNHLSPRKTAYAVPCPGTASTSTSTLSVHHRPSLARHLTLRARTPQFAMQNDLRQSRPPSSRDAPHEVQYVRLVVRSNPDTALPISDLPPPVPTALRGFPSVPGCAGASFVRHNICANVVLAPVKQMLLADIWRNGDAGSNNDLTGLGLEYGWRHHWRIWTTAHVGEAWFVVKHTKSSYRWTDPTALIEPSTASARAAVQLVREQLLAQAPEPQGRSVQDTSFMLGGSSLLSFWNNLREDRGASVWPNPTFAVFPVDDNSPQHRFLTGMCPLSLLNCLWRYLLTCVTPAQPSARHIRPI